MSARRLSKPRLFRLQPQLIPLIYFNPPPPLPSRLERTRWTITPTLKVTLDEILDRQHIPPLSLKDFEEWLLYVETAPETLYFALWLRDYTSKYNQWTRQQIIHNGYPHPSHTVDRVELAVSFARAKNFFFKKESDYCLDLTPQVASPFNGATTQGLIIPEPGVFEAVAEEVNAQLEASLQRFLQGAVSNLGTSRARCGLISACFLILFFVVPALFFGFELDRWIRCAAFPMLGWALTLFLCISHGVCIFLFSGGNLRQLRKPEILREPVPPISNRVYYRPCRLPTDSHVITEQPTPAPILPLKRPPMFSPYQQDITGTRPSTPQPPQPCPSQHPTHLPTPAPLPHACAAPSPLRFRADSTGSSSAELDHDDIEGEDSSDCGSFTSESSHDISTMSAPEIYVSEVYQDYNRLEVDFFHYPFQPGDPLASNPSVPSSDAPEPSATATFIHPYLPLYSDDYVEIPSHDPLPPMKQRLDSFDFAQLPRRYRLMKAPIHEASRRMSYPFNLHPSSCRLTQWLSQSRLGKALGYSDHEERSLPSFASNAPLAPRGRREKYMANRRAQAHVAQFKSVPAFSTPLTRVLSPIVARAQWEIVTRCLGVGFSLSFIIVCCLIALPGYHSSHWVGI